MNEPRDEALDRLLRQTLRPASGAGSTPSCLDAETMSAWMDGGLSGAALAAAEAHAATCPRCRALAAVIARSESFDARPAAALPASEDRRARKWLPWLVPLAAAALIAVAVWIPRGAPQPTPDSTISMAAPAPETAPQTLSLPPLTVPTPPAQNAQAAAAKEAPGVKTETGRADKAEVKPEPPPAPDAAPVEPRQTFRAAASPPPPAPPPPVPPGTTAATSPARALAAAEPVVRPEPATGATALDRTATDTVLAEFQSLSVSQPPADVGAAGLGAGLGPGVAAGGRGGGGAGRGGRAAAPGSIVAQSPPPTVNPSQPTRWRVLASGSVQRSNPPGAPWEPIEIDPGARVTSGTAPGPLVCWLVGRNGVVLLTVNGRSFVRIAFPEAVDLESVRATSAREATVTTVDGRSFETRDGGQSWSRN